MYSVPAKGADGATINKVFNGAADITHMEEGVAKYTTGGMGSTSKQWVQHAEEAMKAGTGDKVAKYLERLERDMVKARNLAGMEVTGSWREELRGLRAQLTADPSSLGKLQSQVSAALERSQTASTILSKMDNKSAVQQVVLKNLLEASDDTKDFAKAIKEAAGKVPLDKVLDAVVLAAATMEVSRGAGEKDPAKVLVGVAEYMSPLGAGLLANITNQIIEASKEAGYDLVAGRQEAFDLLDGIYTARGREDAEGTQYKLDQLVEKYREGDEEKLKGFVYGLCTKASDRAAGSATGATDTKVADAMLKRIYPVILQAWKSAREQMINQCADLRDQYISKGVRLDYAPSPVKIDEKTDEAAVTVRVSTLLGKPEDELSKMRDILTKLYGAGNYWVKVADKWEPSGEEGSNENARLFKFDEPGIYPVVLKRSLDVGGTNFPSNSLLKSSMEIGSALDVKVDGLIITIQPPDIKDKTVKLKALVEGVPPTAKKIGYKWDFRDKDPQNSVVTPYDKPISESFMLESPTHTYTKNNDYLVFLRIYEISKPPARPQLGLGEVRIPIADKLKAGQYKVSFSVSGSNPKGVSMPSDWYVPSINGRAEVTIGASGDFSVSKKWNEGGDPFADYTNDVTITGKINIAEGTTAMTLKFTRSRHYIGHMISSGKEYDVTENDSGSMETTGTLVVTPLGSIKCKTTNRTGSYDSEITFIEIKKDGRGEPDVFKCNAGYDNDSEIEIDVPN